MQPANTEPPGRLGRCSVPSCQQGRASLVSSQMHTMAQADQRCIHLLVSCTRWWARQWGRCRRWLQPAAEQAIHGALRQTHLIVAPAGCRCRNVMPPERHGICGIRWWPCASAAAVGPEHRSSPEVPGSASRPVSGGDHYRAWQQCQRHVPLALPWTDMLEGYPCVCAMAAESWHLHMS